MNNCRDCGHEVSEQAYSCPHCGAPRPAVEDWDGYGYEYISPIALFGLPLIHISFKYRQNKIPVVARGIIAIGQFAVGFIAFGQLALGVATLGQITLSLYTLAQIGLSVFGGYGQIIRSLF